MTKVLTGKQFHEKYKDKVFVKLTNKDEIHNRFQFKTGLNIDTIPFNPKGECQPGGLYFTDKQKLAIWLNYADEDMYYVREVSLPDDAYVYEESDKFKANKMILSEKEMIGEMSIWKDKEYCLGACKLYGGALRFVDEQTPCIILEAVKQNAFVLDNVKQQTKEICERRI